MCWPSALECSGRYVVISICREELDAHVAAKRTHMKEVQAAIAELKGDAAETKAQTDSAMAEAVPA